MSTKLQVVVNRYSFFRQQSGHTLRFRERSPECAEPEHGVCDCTSAVDYRPPGKPDSEQQSIAVMCDERPYRWEMKLGATECSFRWREPYESRGRLAPAFDGTFTFGPDSLEVSLDLPGYGLTDHFFGHVFRGNKVDISTLMNGHSPSRIIRLEDIGEKELWVHDCMWGHEAFLSFGSDDEADLWRKAFDRADLIRSWASTSCEDLTTDVSILHETIASDSLHLDEVCRLNDFLVVIIQDLKNSTLFLLCNEVYEQTMEAMKKERADAGTDALLHNNQRLG